jgi:hypothetical protein
VAGCDAMGRDVVSVRESILPESPSQETASCDRHQAGCSLRTPREHRKWLTQVRVLAGSASCPGAALLERRASLGAGQRQMLASQTGLSTGK